MVLHPQKPNEVDRCIVSELDYICNRKKKIIARKFSRKISIFLQNNFF